MENTMNKAVIMGLGYVGLPTSALLADKGVIVHGVDVDLKIVESINSGKTHIIEPDLEKLVTKTLKEGNFSANSTPASADVFIISVPTPLDKNLKPDLNFVYSAIETITPYLDEGNLLLIESTTPVGTTEKIAEMIFDKRPNLRNNIFITYCPERVLPGNILFELENNDRILGGINEISTDMAENFYSSLLKGKIYKTDSRTAEMVKLTENSYRDVNIAFANELSMICSKNNIDVNNLIELSNKHPRVNILQPGCGVGGPCLAIDPWFIVDLEPELSKLIRTAREINDFKPKWIFELVEDNIRRFINENGKEPVISVFGLTYKPDVDDIFESPAVKITEMLLKSGYPVKIVEPNLKKLPKSLKKFKNATMVKIEEAVKADFGLMLVKHKEFQKIIKNNQ